ncbi:MAG: hypothetical protein JO103_13035 [Candidatus Eremiobacteraeota bacterium]|nr:hypothetical protein [Candidatus Eremiobacteraeota bacterium]MBV8645666.1 hypothetical protein [Candidatus Eremiobacteraeota bacterium]MBV8750627.1 hypothetical protein [Candidatus Eremiobacteraeota bacterium]
MNTINEQTAAKIGLRRKNAIMLTVRTSDSQPEFQIGDGTFLPAAEVAAA